MYAVRTEILKHGTNEFSSGQITEKVRDAFKTKPKITVAVSGALQRMTKHGELNSRKDGGRLMYRCVVSNKEQEYRQFRSTINRSCTLAASHRRSRLRHTDASCEARRPAMR